METARNLDEDNTEALEAMAQFLPAMTIEIKTTKKFQF